MAKSQFVWPVAAQVADNKMCGAARLLLCIQKYFIFHILFTRPEVLDRITQSDVAQPLSVL